MHEPKWDLSVLSAGEKSALRRNAGIMMDSDSTTMMQALEAFYRAKCSYCNKETEKAWFAAMCMECLWRDDHLPPKKPLPELLGMIYQNSEESESTKKRCIAFLDYEWTDDGFLLGKICNLIRLIRAKHMDYMPDFDALAYDLSRWNKHEIQRKWLRTICLKQTKLELNKEEINNAG